MASEGICPGCGRSLPEDGLKGLCPECLMRAGFGTGAVPAPGEPTERAAFTPPSLEQVARLFPQLEVVELLGQGGMGAVYKARQPALDRWVALKVLPPQAAAKADFSERFNREARALARLNHPHIVAVYEFGQSGNLAYLVMEYVDGVSLRQLVQAGKLPPEQALAIVPQICDALQFAHDEGIVHRDVKPENILLDRKGRVKIADFGIAKIVGSEPAGRQPITQDQQVIGTPHYMAPEQVEQPHQVDHRADIYSLGVVFYEMLTGELPLGRFAPPSRKVQVDVRLDEVVLHALEKEPQRRYQHASEVKTDVETITQRSDAPAGFEPAGLIAARAVPGRASWWRWLPGASGLVIVAGLVFWLFGFYPVRLRDFARRASPGEAQPTVPRTTSNNAPASGAPVGFALAEHTLHSLRDREALDLDSGRVVVPQEGDEAGGPEDLGRWMHLNHAEIAARLEGDVWSLFGKDLMIAVLAEEPSAGLKAADLRYALASGGRSGDFPIEVIGMPDSLLRLRLLPQQGPPVRCAFLTASGNLGLLELSGATAAGGTLRLRCRLVQDGLPTE